MPEIVQSGKVGIEQRLRRLCERVRTAEHQYGREPGSVQILPVSKARPAADILTVASLGLPGIGHAFGESYLQEAEPKLALLAAQDIEWHFIGPLQSNKTQAIARLFQWVHSVDRAKIAQRLSDQRPAGLPPLNICLQVNISGEASKSGLRPNELGALAEQVSKLPNLRLRGLMAIPAANSDFGKQRAAFAALRKALESLQSCSSPPSIVSPGLDTLSMGMSSDLEAAIAEGATLVRIGTDVFGPRNTK
jgi:PLP dependent protein